MKPKTRYNIRLALRKGVEVRSVGVEGLQIAKAHKWLEYGKHISALVQFLTHSNVL